MKKITIYSALLLIAFLSQLSLTQASVVIAEDQVVEQVIPDKDPDKDKDKKCDKKKDCKKECTKDKKSCCGDKSKATQSGSKDCESKCKKSCDKDSGAKKL